MRQDDDRRRLAPVVTLLEHARRHEAPVLAQSAETVAQSAADLEPSAEDRRLEKEEGSKKTKAQ